MFPLFFILSFFSSVFHTLHNDRNFTELKINFEFITSFLVGIFHGSMFLVAFLTNGEELEATWEVLVNSDYTVNKEKTVVFCVCVCIVIMGTHCMCLYRRYKFDIIQVVQRFHCSNTISWIFSTHKIPTSKLLLIIYRIVHK